jgi:hypothetical protein
VRFRHWFSYWGSDASTNVKSGAAHALRNLAARSALNKSVVVDAGAITPLVQLLGPDLPADLQVSAAGTLYNLAMHNLDADILNQDRIASAGAIPALVQLLRPDVQAPADVHTAAVRALCALSKDHAPNKAIVTSAGAIPIFVQLGPGSSEDAQEAVAVVLSILANDHTPRQAAIVAAGALPALEQLQNASSAGVQAAAARALGYFDD